MMLVALGIFLLLHGVVYLLYLGQSVRLFSLHEGMAWPDDAWALAWIASPAPIRAIAAAVCLVAAAGFIAAGVALLAGQGWWREVALYTAAVAAAAFFLLWDATAGDLSGQGAVAVVINAALLAGLLAVPHPGLVA
jgi:hypothetical protein